jgi:hypothetical protein
MPWVLACGVALGCEHRPSYKPPPADSFSGGAYSMTLEGAVTSVPGASVAPGFFTAAEARPLLGRFFVESDYRTTSPDVVVLSQDLWQKHFASDPSYIGRQVDINRRPAVVVGIAPPGFQIPDGAHLWIPRRQ